MTRIVVSRGLLTRGTSILLRVLSDAVTVGDATLVQRIRNRLLADGISVSDLANATYVPGGGGAAGFEPESGFNLTGTIGHGNSLTLTRSGGGFGTGPSIVHWDEVSNQYAGLSEGNTIPTGVSDPYEDNTPLGGGIVQYSVLNLRHSNQAANYKFTGKGTLEWPRILGGSNPPNGQDRIYARFWLRRNTTGTGGTSESSKMIRVWDADGNGTRISAGTLQLTIFNSEGLDVDGGGFGQQSVGSWVLYELYVDDVGNIIRSYKNGAQFGSFDSEFKDSGFTNIGFNIKLFGYDTGSSDPTIASWQMSDIYAAESRARIVIANNATWGSVTSAQEAQIVGAWADGTLGFDQFNGQFGSSLSGRHLHIRLANDTGLYAGAFT